MLRLPCTLVFIALTNFAAAFVQASTGFGYSLIAMSIMPLFLPMAQCSAISAVTVVAIGLQMTFSLRKNFCLKTVLLPLLCCIVTINLGLHLLYTLDEQILRRILACLLILVTALFYIMQKKKIALPRRWYSPVGAGLLAGISTGLFNIVGPFFLIYYINVCKNNLHLKSSLEFTFLMAGLYSTGMHLFVYNNIHRGVMPEITVSVLAALLAGVIGLRLYRKIDKTTITRLVYILLPIMAVALVISGPYY